MSMESILVTVSPDRLREMQDLPVTPVHMAYRMGKGPHLFRVSGSAAPRGGFMFLDCRSFDGLGPTPPFCQEVLRECMDRGFTGVVCDFESGRIPPLEQVVQELGNQVDRAMRSLLDSDERISTTMAAVLTAIPNADAAKKAEDSADNLRAQMKGYLDDNSRTRQEMESLRRELNELRRRQDGQNR